MTRHEEIAIMLDDYAGWLSNAEYNLSDYTAVQLLVLMGEWTRTNIPLPSKLEDWEAHIRKTSVELAIAEAMHSAENLTVPFDIEICKSERDFVEWVICGAMAWISFHPDQSDECDLIGFDELVATVDLFEARRAIDVAARGYEYSWINSRERNTDDDEF